MPALVRRIALSLAVFLGCVALFGCSSGPSDYSGGVVDDTVTLQAPALAMPAVDLDAGFVPEASGGAAGPEARRSTVTTLAAITALGSVTRVTSVAVRAGDEVRAGAEIARLDSAALDANVAVAKAAHAVAKAQVGVIDDALGTVASSRSTLAVKRREVNAAAAQLASTRATIAAQLADLKAGLKRLEAMSGGRPAPAKAREGVARLTAALSKIDAGLAKVARGRAQLSSAGARLSDARTQLTDIRSLARVAVDASAVGIRLAEYRRELAVLRAPADGVVVSVVSAGEILAPGAGVAKIRRTGAPRVATWIAPGELSSVRVGTPAEVSGDWFGISRGTEALRGRVSRIGSRAEFPPTSFATDEVHLTRAVRVEITLPKDIDRPVLHPGVPVDVRILGR